MSNAALQVTFATQAVEVSAALFISQPPQAHYDEANQICSEEPVAQSQFSDAKNPEAPKEDSTMVLVVRAARFKKDAKGVAKSKSKKETPGKSEPKFKAAAAKQTAAGETTQTARAAITTTPPPLPTTVSPQNISGNLGFGALFLFSPYEADSSEVGKKALAIFVSVASLEPEAVSATIPDLSGKEASISILPSSVAHTHNPDSLTASVAKLIAMRFALTESAVVPRDPIVEIERKRDLSDRSFVDISDIVFGANPFENTTTISYHDHPGEMRVGGFIVEGAELIIPQDSIQTVVILPPWIVNRETTNTTLLAMSDPKVRRGEVDPTTDTEPSDDSRREKREGDSDTSRGRTDDPYGEDDDLEEEDF
ncbi:MAG: hypothetical protein A2W61_05730 [Deltaproteobacteria bacterium RIFCSPLOWO2_01_44_7]|nr:MAG: hypothetical protein A2712_04500 [Deltaproteobacteria bacterium RIFCSPHIGHO2_01_FULL_43_49]OGQ16440.1 MAG: hypothetical protein A3D22_02465 [Deltaproteobacteria bacterium RIFCSPHIGHO2_02_FULL_44_53]OGQ27732.1 MAG: hypothetical protein A3D98_08520 [Deltaproteobacteria bacterium RIFCSPHIGHO2_12_FULL_44_21]OGQ32958.1 MAG: hypothetical protein A2979_10395 [Deltaproteobacteria bacterium RIFCSPLOWO2_01_FULL_45_74]OGQ40400.1 MAG: hypothetical protein A2W61_05730 [Deltaproteobacteria bacterium 